MVGRTVSHYRILDRLGGGGMGVVYRAEDLRLGRQVALKFLSADLARDPQALDRFRREARAASALNHPHICTIYDIDNAEGESFIAMELLEGQTLKERLQGRPLPTAEIVALGLQLADALEAAHAKGIIHRDLKPANVFITTRGIAKLLDFGLAKLAVEPHAASEAATAAGEWVTGAGAALGTVGYMSPEQIRGEMLDARTDLFSLGVVLYEMTTGTAPFRGATSGTVLSEILTKGPVAPVRLNPEVPPELERIVSKLLEKDREVRYQSAKDLRVDLTRLKRERESGRVAASGVAAAPLTPSLAVLPFANLSANKENEYFSDGLAEDIIDALTQVPGLRVMARTSAFAFRGKDADVREIGARLNVEHILEGSVRRAGNRLRVTAQLVKASDGFHLWSERYDRELDDVFAVQDGIARAIVEKLRVRLVGPAGAPLVKRPTDNLEAYQLYLKGRYLWAHRYSVGLEPALKCFAHAVELAPDFPAALAGLADCYTTTGIFSLAPIGDMLPKARAAAERALALDDTCAEAHHALGALHLFLDWNWPVIERELTRALELNPALPISRVYYALGLAEMGRTDEALREAEQAVSFDPLSAFVAYVAGGVCYWLGLNQRAVDEAQRAADLDPHMVLSSYLRALALSAVGRHEEAIETAQCGVTQSGRSATMVTVLAAVLGAAGEDRDARALLDELLVRRQREYVADGLLAIALAAVGDWDATLTAMERAAAERGGSYPWLLAIRVFDPIRRDPRFTKILETIGYTGTSAILLGHAV